MIKIYLDWNVMAQMKNGSHKELAEILSNKERFLTPFSTAHIGDIFSSFNGSEKQKKFIDSDLEFISKFTAERCLHIQKDVVIIDYYSPKELFEQRIESDQLMENLSTKGFFSIFDGMDIPQEIIIPFKNLLKSIPIEAIIQDALNDPEKAAQTEKLFPGLKDNLTFEGMLNSTIKMMQGLNENDSYKNLRETVQLGFNICRDKMFDSKDPCEQIDKLYEKAEVQRPDNLRNSKNGPKWYNEICDEYVQLDMHGYQEDKVNTQKGRKVTFKNTTEDAFHCAFATTCNFYITNDNKTYKKSKKVYEKFEVQTVVFKPGEFVEYFKDYLDLPNDSTGIHLVGEMLGKFKYYEEDMGDAKLRIYFLPYYLFDFFNKVMTIVSYEGETESLILSRNNPTHNFTLPIEIKKLIARLNASFGSDNNNYGELCESELEEDAWRERIWSNKSIKLTLRRVDGHFQFYLNFLTEEVA